jgi:hypothetical protein
MALVGPFYLQMMGLNAARGHDELIGEVAALGRTTTSDEVSVLLRSDWRPRAMGAWYSVFHDRSTMAAPLLESLRTSAGSLTAPPLAVAAVEIAGVGALDSLRAYNEVDQRQGLGSSGFVAAAIEHLGSLSAVCEPTDADRRDLASLLAVARRLAAA